MNEECGINWDEQEKISWDDAENIKKGTMLIINLPDQTYTPYFIEVDHVVKKDNVIQVYDKFVYDIDLRDPETCMPPFHIDSEHYDFTKEEWEGNVFGGGPEIEDAVYSAVAGEREEGDEEGQGNQGDDEDDEFQRCCSYAAEKEKEARELQMLQKDADRRRRDYLDQNHGKYSGYGKDSFMGYMSDYVSAKEKY